MLLDSFIVVFGIPAVLPVVCKKALAKEKSKISFLTSKKKERYGASERNAGIFAESIPFAKCHVIQKNRFTIRSVSDAIIIFSTSRGVSKY